ncbi:MAG: tRNA (guanosine(37)-N1)-methyltransferase TrmD [Clostridia bacterium]|nr:tRNA (guanosine(37)-N1)-methyltransferase TrmD [Clostridia bacterium]
MRIDILTLFPEMCNTVMNESITGRAIKKGVLQVYCHQIRDYTYDKHNRVDDTVYGGGKGMLLLAEPIADCFEHICADIGEKPYFVYMSPKGKILNQEKIKQLSKHKNIAILCGRYEGVDQRLIDNFVDEEISIGDYVLTGGELPALILADSISRLVPGVLSDDECFMLESHYNGLLECPQYTKPAVWRGHQVPQVLLSGHHENVDKWRYEQALEITKKRRPDMLKDQNDI